MYLNDFKFLNNNNVQSLNLIDNFCIENITTYLRILILFCADDVLLISESANGLQNALNAFSLYYKQWKLKVSTNKTKIMVFSKRNFGIDSFFLFDNTKLEVCEDISYLGFTLNYNGSFIKAKNKLVQQAHKAVYSIYRKVQNVCTPVDLQLKLFDSIVLPIPTYSCEVWGFENCAEIEKVHLRFCKKILKVRQTTSNYMVYGELGRYPFEYPHQCQNDWILVKIKEFKQII